MTVFEKVKAAVTTREAAEMYGMYVRNNGMTHCPFHEDHTPSMKLDQRFYCFGCHAQGDVIDFTARLFGITTHDAAVKLSVDFGISEPPSLQPNIQTQGEFAGKLHAADTETVSVRVSQYP